MVVLLKIIPLELRTVPTDRTDIDHPRAVLDEGAPLDRNVDIRKILQAEVDEGLELV